MTRLQHATLTAILLSIMFIAMLAPVAAQPPGAGGPTTDAEVGCQVGTSLAVGGFVRDKSQCIDGCEKKAFASGATADCGPPYSGDLEACVAAAETSAGAVIQSSCSQDCPECYSGGDCASDAGTRIADAEDHVDALASEVFCDDSGSTDGLALAEFKCQKTVRKFIAKFWAAKLRCYAKCRKSEAGGRIPAGACAAPAADQKTQDCIAAVEEKTAFLIDNKCESALNPSADKPECSPYDVRDGAGWVAAEESAVDDRVPGLFCNDPAPTTTTTTTAAP